MVYTGSELTREIRSMIQSIIYEGTQYVEIFSYDLQMENNWKAYEETDYPVLIRAKDIEVERIKEVFGIKDENIVELNKEKGLYLCEKAKENYISIDTKWFLTIRSDEEYTEEDFREKVKEYIERKGKGVNNEEEIAEVMEKEKEGRNKELTERAERYIESIQKDIEKYNGYIEDCEKSIETKKRELEALKKEKNIKDKVKKELKYIKEHEVVKEVYYKPTIGKLIIRTKTLYMQHPTDKFDRRLLGKMKIILDVNNYDVKLFNETECKKGYWGDDCNHPHVSEAGEPCLGNSGDMLAECKLNNDLYIAFLTILGFLQQFDPMDAAGEYYVCWDRVDEEGNVIEKGAEDKYIATCCVCGEGIHEEDSYYACDECGGTMCSDHEYWVDDTSLCENCYNKLTEECTICGEVHLRDNMLYVDGQWVCNDCQDEYVISCVMCGEEHLIDNMIEDLDTCEYYCEACWEEHEKEKEEEENV